MVTEKYRTTGTVTIVARQWGISLFHMKKKETIILQ